MANLNAPQGFVPVCDASGRRYTGSGNRYYKGTAANTVIAKGDRVTRVVSTDPKGFPEIVKSAPGAPCTGVVVGFEVTVSDLHKLCYTATDTGYLMVEDDPNILYMIQESGTPLTIAAIGQYINPIANLDGDLQTGLSKLTLNNATLGTGGGGVACRIERLDQSPDNTLGAFAKWLVQLNQSTEINAGANNLTGL